MKTVRWRGPGTVAVVASVLLSSGWDSGAGGETAASMIPLKVRPPAVAGAFYPTGKESLSGQVGDLLGQAKSNGVSGALVAAVVPHAGYVYSGRCAAAVFCQVKANHYKRIIILGPSHHLSFVGVSVPNPDIGAYRTPLGDVKIDRKVCDALSRCSGFSVVPGADTKEHSIEVELPFLQMKAGEFELVPLVCGGVRETEIEGVAKAIASFVDSNTLLVASSDFTHFGPGYGYVPFDRDIKANLYRRLEQSSGSIAALDLAGFRAHCDETQDTICGRIPIMLLLSVLKQIRPDVKGQVLDRYLSGDLSGDYASSVSYAAIGFFSDGGGVAAKEDRPVKEKLSGTWTPDLSSGEKATLFAIARETLAWCVDGSREPFSFTKYSITPKLKTDTATFVTLKIKGHLRGCIGSLMPVEPLYQSVHHNAVNAALKDYRFDPVTLRELPLIEVDVSVLSPIVGIQSLDEFKIGAQGIIMEKGGRTAVYLPEVAVEQGWSREETLSSLSQKAGLDKDAWRQGAKFKVFQSAVLSE